MMSCEQLGFLTPPCLSNCSNKCRYSHIWGIHKYPSLLIVASASSAPSVGGSGAEYSGMFGSLCFVLISYHALQLSIETRNENRKLERKQMVPCLSLSNFSIFVIYFSIFHLYVFLFHFCFILFESIKHIGEKKRKACITCHWSMTKVLSLIFWTLVLVPWIYYAKGERKKDICSSNSAHHFYTGDQCTNGCWSTFMDLLVIEDDNRLPQCGDHSVLCDDQCQSGVQVMVCQ